MTIALTAIMLSFGIAAANDNTITNTPTIAVASTVTNVIGSSTSGGVTTDVGTLTRATDGIGTSESFETGFGGWTADHHLQCEIDKTCDPLEWNITRSREQAYDGIYSLKGYINGIHDDGTIWVERSVEVTPNSNISIEISFYLWSLRDSDMNNWPVLAYAGLNDPEHELDFKIIGQTDQFAGWKKYSYSTQLTTDSSGIFWAGFGFGATWEVQRTYYLDLVDIKITEKKSTISPYLQNVLENITDPTTKIPVIMIVQKDYFNQALQIIRSYKENVSNVKEITLINAIAFEAIPSTIIELSNLEYTDSVDFDYSTKIAKTADGDKLTGVGQVPETKEWGENGSNRIPVISTDSSLAGDPSSRNILLYPTDSEKRGVLESGSVSAEYSGKLEVKDSRIYMGISGEEKQINILPDEAVKLSETPYKENVKVELKEKNKKPVYSITGTKQVKLFFIIPLSMEINTEMDAGTGLITSVNKPWWGFLAR